MQVLVAWQGLAVLGIVLISGWGLWWVFADVLLERFGSPLIDRAPRPTADGDVSAFPPP